MRGARFVLAVTTVLTLPAAAQVFHVVGGSSSQTGASGASVETHSGKYDFRLSAGVLHGKMKLGALLRTQLRGYEVKLGDDTLPFRLPTDVFDASHFVHARGLGLSRETKKVKWMVFTGVSSNGFSLPYLQAQDGNRPLSMAFLDVKLTPTLTFTSRNTFAREQTLIQAMQWRPRDGVEAAASAGIGANQGYFAGSFTFERLPKLRVKGSYIVAGARFRRMQLRDATASEVDRENIEITYQPKDYLTLRGSRMNVLQPQSEAGDLRPGLRAAVNHLGVGGKWFGFRLSSGFYDSRFHARRVSGNSFSAGRDITTRIHGNVSLYRSKVAAHQTTSILLASAREVITPRLTLSQTLSRSSGQSSWAFGGSYLANRFSLDVQHQVLFVPFLQGSQFKQVAAVTLSLRPFGNYEVLLSNHVAPDGTVRYTAYASTYLYRGDSLGGMPAGAAISLPKLMARGRVVDTQGQPVRGAAVRVDGKDLFTDSEGRFYLRRSRPGPFALTVAVAEFVASGRYEVVSAPDQVKALPDEDEEGEVIVVVRRLPNGAKR